ARNQSFTVYAVCSDPFQGYSVNAGPTVSNTGQTGSDARCPSADVALGGGIAASSTAPSVNINTTVPVGAGWHSWENNAGTSTDTITTYVTCANPTSYPRPKGATPLRASLVPAYQPCTSPNEQHGAPLSSNSCSPPAQASPNLTVGTLDANGAPANSVGSVRFDVKNNAPPTPNDVLIDVSTTDVRCRLPVN